MPERERDRDDPREAEVNLPPNFNTKETFLEALQVMETTFRSFTIVTVVIQQVQQMYLIVCHH